MPTPVSKSPKKSAPPPGFKGQEVKVQRSAPPPGFKGHKSAPPPGFKGEEEMGQGDSAILGAGAKRQITQLESEQDEPPTKTMKTGKY